MSRRRNGLLLDRRSFLLGAGLSGIGLWGAGRTTAAQAAAPASPRSCRPTNPLQALRDGNARFAAAWQQADEARSADARAQRMAALWSGHCFLPASVLTQGQAPWACVLTCADSRVAPEWIFDAAPADLFVIRSAGNTAFAAAIASVEFSVLELATPLVMVMGHSGCGAVTAARSGDAPTPLLTELLTPIRAAISPDQNLEAAIKANAREAAQQLISRSNVIEAAVNNGNLEIVVGYFDIGSGTVTLV
ncbi:Carbonic anhydrase beta class [Synechococcus sp. WH 8101]|uniref:carbonic anhydrase n=1 Tax=Synechococcus sp. WH 8101 TaxID=59932 RepID=UPI001022E5D3|nr:carbonic anhydrase [Synechococcus sp. WH 8101]QBE70351.1 Carbonic anhydrase beta class [Synechococcus sp. WH 8101]QNI46625.1 carbonic anhydrase family protein [Synechococcus sp. WH 8101]